MDTDYYFTKVEMAEAAAKCEPLPKSKEVKKIVTFSNEDTIEEYTSPYCDPSFMKSFRSRRCQHVLLSATERMIVETFYKHFEISFDPATSVSSEQIHKWFNRELERYGKSKWSIQGKKWAYVVLRLNLSYSLWKHRDQSIVASPVTSPSVSKS